MQPEEAGSAIAEKHLTLDKTMEGPDHQASLTGVSKSTDPGLQALDVLIDRASTDGTPSGQAQVKNEVKTDKELELAEALAGI